MDRDLPDDAGTAAFAPLYAPVRPAKLPDQVYEQILLRIAAGQLETGQRLPSEPRLCDMFGVSRPVVREALARLRADGIIASRRGSGSYVRRAPSSAFMQVAPSAAVAELLRCFEARLALEGEAAFLAAQRRRPADLTAIDAAIDQLRRAIAEGDLGVAADIAFHRAVAQATRNDLFERMMDVLRAPMRDGIAIARRLSRSAAGARLRLVHDEHVRILEAIQAQAPEAARSAMRAHIDHSRNRMLGFPWSR